MDKKPNSVSTNELFASLEKSNSLESFYAKYDEDLSSSDICEQLSHLLEKHHMTKQAVIQSANLERSLGYQIFNGYRHARRDVVISIALGMQLSLEETQRLLRSAQHGELYPKNRRDAALIYCITHQMDLIHTQMLLDEVDEKPLK